MTARKDYYGSLGISSSASQDEVKKAFRKLAQIHHPDKKGDEEKFKEINEAFQVLGDENKRKAYDNLGKATSEGGASTGSGETTGPRQTSKPGQTRTTHREYTGDPLDDLFGDQGWSSYFESMFSGTSFDAEGLFGSTRPRQTKTQEVLFEIPENDYGLLFALERAYEASGDGEWVANRVPDDKRNKMPRSLWKVKRQNGNVKIYRRIQDLRTDGDVTRPIEIRNSQAREANGSYPVDSYIGEYFFTPEGIKGLKSDSPNIPDGYSLYLDAMRSIGRKLADANKRKNEGKVQVDIGYEFTIINNFIKLSGHNYAKEGRRNGSMEPLESVRFPNFFDRFNLASTVVEGKVATSKEGGKIKWGDEEKIKWGNERKL
jgi:curved DNA-binding protein CbpA